MLRTPANVLCVLDFHRAYNNDQLPQTSCVCLKLDAEVLGHIVLHLFVRHLDNLQDNSKNLVYLLIHEEVEPVLLATKYGLMRSLKEVIILAPFFCRKVVVLPYDLS